MIFGQYVDQVSLYIPEPDYMYGSFTVGKIYYEPSATVISIPFYAQW